MTFFVLADEDVVTGFQFVGIEGKIIENRDSAEEEFKKVTDGTYGELGIVLISEKVSVLLEEKIMQWQLEGGYPLIVEIPDLGGHLEGKKTMLEAIREAIGLAV